MATTSRARHRASRLEISIAEYLRVIVLQIDGSPEKHDCRIDPALVRDEYNELAHLVSGPVVCRGRASQHEQLRLF